MPKKRSKKPKTAHIENASVALTHLIGTPASLIIHSVFFLGCFVLMFFGYEPDRIMLLLTTLVSLEAIYLSILIQMTVNRNIESLKEVEENIDEIQEDVEELTEDIGEIQEDVAELGEDIEEDSEKEEQTDKLTRESINKIEISLQKIISEIENIKSENDDRTVKK